MKKSTFVSRFSDRFYIVFRCCSWYIRDVQEDV
ncbi:hypothetical protein I656_03604 [Geobacillus sp. WSUCF1]|nr:hypothetical protein I656_03604 [Geobacillus sp. WSUCF1]